MSLLNGLKKDSPSPVLESYMMERDAEDEESMDAMEAAFAFQLEMEKADAAEESMNTQYLVDEDDDDLEAFVNDPETAKKLAKEKEDHDLGEDSDDTNFGNEYESGFEADMAAIAASTAEMLEATSLATEAYELDEDDQDPIYDPSDFDPDGNMEVLTSEEAAQKLEAYMEDDVN